MHCARCHAQPGEARGPQLGTSQGPDLRNIGRRRSPEWIADYIRQPTNRRPDARMPAFAGQLSEEQIRVLADYLYQRSIPTAPSKASSNTPAPSTTRNPSPH
jgi:mono/diheme cytochrome c family protein